MSKAVTMSPHVRWDSRDMSPEGVWAQCSSQPTPLQLTAVYSAMLPSLAKRTRLKAPPFSSAGRLSNLQSQQQCRRALSLLMYAVHAASPQQKIPV